MHDKKKSLSNELNNLKKLLEVSFFMVCPLAC